MTIDELRQVENKLVDCEALLYNKKEAVKGAYTLSERSSDPLMKAACEGLYRGVLESYKMIREQRIVISHILWDRLQKEGQDQ